MCLTMEQEWDEWTDLDRSSVHLLLFAGHIRANGPRYRM